MAWARTDLTLISGSHESEYGTKLPSKDRMRHRQVRRTGHQCFVKTGRNGDGE